MQKEKRERRIIQIDNYSSYPRAIINLVLNNKEYLLLNTKDTATFQFDWDKRIKNSDPRLLMLKNDISTVLNDYSIELFHLSRVLSIDSISKYGLKKLEDNFYLKYMNLVFIELGFLRNERNQLLYQLQSQLRGINGNGRTDRISLFAPCSEYLLKKKDGGYVNLYGENIGGEIAKITFNRHNDIVYNRLLNNGKTVIVNIVIPFSFFTKKHSEICYDDSLVLFVENILKHEKLLDSVEPFFLAQTDIDIEPKYIKNIKVLE